MPELIEAERDLNDLRGRVSESLRAARNDLKDGKAGDALTVIHTILDLEPKNAEAQGGCCWSGTEVRQTGLCQQIRQDVDTRDRCGSIALRGSRFAGRLHASRINGEWDVVECCDRRFREAEACLRCWLVIAASLSSAAATTNSLGYKRSSLRTKEPNVQQTAAFIRRTL
jgi:hypothetical protein